MKIIPQSVELIDHTADLIGTCAQAAALCYQSETIGDPAEFIAKRMAAGHMSVIEHGSITLKFTTNRGVTHELVRHRLMSFSQESTRYCNYISDKFDGEITVIDPTCAYGWDTATEIGAAKFAIWKAHLERAEAAYAALIAMGVPAQQARDVLPNALVARIMVTANPREWNHFFALRAFGTTGKPHPQMQECANMAWELCHMNWPVLFPVPVKQ